MDLVLVREPRLRLLPGLRRRYRRDGLLLVARDAVGSFWQESFQIPLPLGRDAPDHAPAFFNDLSGSVAALPTFITSIRSLDVVR